MPENTSSSSQKGRIFISYRRADSEGYAGRIYDRLAPHFGDDAIFMDVDDIPAGVDFVKYLENEVQSCDVLIALIGKQWLNVEDEHGLRRLDNPNDFVRIEIGTALKRDIRVIPVLLGGTQMPNVSDLPENLQSLTRRNGLLVYHHSFHADTNRLIKHLENALGAAEKDRERIAKEKANREAAERDAKEKADRETAEKAAREKAEKEITEKAAHEKAEKEATEIAAKEKAEREAVEKVAREKAEKEAAEKARLDAEEKARQKAAREKAKREATEKAEHEAAEKAKREKAERQAARRDAIKNLLPKLVPFLRVIGIVGIALVLFWAGSWAIPKFASLVPTPKATSSTQTYTAKITFTNSPVTPTKTTKPTSIPIKTPTKTLAPIPTSLPDQITDAKGVQMMLVGASSFTMGSDGEYDQPDERPAHQVSLDTYYIDKYEVTNAFYKDCVDSGSCQLPAIPKNGASHYNNPESSNYPVVYVNWYMANAYCKWRGARLPTEAEWEKAAQSSGSYGTWADYIREVGANYNQSGTFGYDISKYGVYDMMHNVTEWVSSLYKPYPYSSTDGREDLNASGKRTLRGGNFKIRAYLISNTRRYSNFLTYAEFNVGFRCAKSVP